MRWLNAWTAQPSTLRTRIQRSSGEQFVETLFIQRKLSRVCSACSVDIECKTGLILSGGGARAAYQAGVLQAISRILGEAGWPAARNPFEIICGTSAGALNAAGLACRADDFGDAVDQLADVWEGIDVTQVYRADSLGVLRSGAR